ncbi:MAG TPA: response regulator [Vicinamibacteria bacterium]|nr:response regulator [Vicinamibacteria bacterium]
MGYALVVGPDNPDRAWIESTLLQGGLEVAAASEADVLVTSDLLPPRLVVLDDATSREARLASLRRLQAHPALKGVPVLMLAYEGDVESFTEAITKGVAAYLVKPTSANELVETAQRLSGWEGGTEHTERRRRIRRPLIMKIEAVNKATKEHVMGHFADVSGSGCRIEVPMVLKPGDLLRVILHSQDASTHVALGIEVRWAREKAPGTTEAGCRFTGTTALLAGKMLGFVSSGLT